MGTPAAGRGPNFLGLADKVPGGSFAFVMATGIVSVDAERQGFHRLALILFAINVAAFLVLFVALSLRLARSPADLLGEIVRHRTGVGYLTIVAGTAILGNQTALLTADRQVAAGLWLTACVLWAALVYAFFVGLTVRRTKPPLAAGLDGTWLLLTVASQSLAVLGTHVASAFAHPDIVLYLSLCWFALGGFFYALVIALILYRWLFEPMPAAQWTLAYWINMGAVAITTLAGARLAEAAGADPLLTGLRPAVTAATILAWSVATWWIPLLLALTVWRHAIGGVRLSYRLEYWSVVFPLGMYSAGTWTFVHATGARFLNVIPQAFLWIALATWLATLGGMTGRAVGAVGPAGSHSK